MDTRLRQARKARGWRMCRLALEANVSYSQLCRIERGWCTPAPATAERLARALGTTREDLGLPGGTRKEVPR